MIDAAEGRAAYLRRVTPQFGNERFATMGWPTGRRIEIVLRDLRSNE